MHQILKASIASIALAAFAVAPIAIVLTPELAYAKNGNGGGGNGNSGGGNSGGGGGGNSGGGGGNGSSDKGNSGGSSDKGNGGNKDKSSAAKSSSSKSTAVATAAASKSKKASGSTTKGSSKKSAASKPKSPKVAKVKSSTKTTLKRSMKPMPKPQAKVLDAMHPSNLGKLNGAINASVNAKLAHIRNGNFNGPVGLAAALALADYNYGVKNDAYAAASQALELAAAFDLIDNAQQELDALTAAEALTGDKTKPTDQEISDAQAVIAAGEIGDAYTAATQTLELAAAFELIDNAQQELDVLTAAEALTGDKTKPTDQEISDAQAVIAAGEIGDAYSAASQTLELAAAFDLIDNAQQELDALTAAGALTGDRTKPTDQEIIDAQVVADAGEPTKDGVTDAEAALLAAYKGTLDEEATAKVLGAVRASLPTQEQIADVTRFEETAEEAALAEAPIILIDDAIAISE